MTSPTTYTTTLDSPIGPLLLTSDGTALTRLLIGGDPDPSWSPEPCPVLESAVAQLQEYFAGSRTEFDLPLAPTGTPFQQSVWRALRDIPYAGTESYGQLAARVGNSRASRAVGLANGRNPISIVVPCHRVVGANGSLVGYGGGLDRKRTLLDLERRTAGTAPGAADPQLTLL